MAHFAEIKDGIVVRVLVVGNDQCLDADGVESEAAGQEFLAQRGGLWLQTSYNTHGGERTDGMGGKPPFRKNYAGAGYAWREDLDAFVPPKPFDSWSLDPDACQWKAPMPKPDDGKLYSWDEENLRWEEDSEQ